MKKDSGSVRSTFICCNAARCAAVTLLGVPTLRPPVFFPFIVSIPSTLVYSSRSAVRSGASLRRFFLCPAHSPLAVLRHARILARLLLVGGASALVSLPTLTFRSRAGAALPGRQ